MIAPFRSPWVGFLLYALLTLMLVVESFSLGATSMKTALQASNSSPVAFATADANHYVRKTQCFRPCRRTWFGAHIEPWHQCGHSY